VPQSQREVMTGGTIMFYLKEPHGRTTATIIGPAKNDAHRKAGWYRVIWADGDSRTQVQLSDERRSKSDDIRDLELGQWAILSGAEKHQTQNAAAFYANDDYIVHQVFVSFNEGVEEADEHKDLGPFTIKQAMRRDDWPMFEKAIEKELAGLVENNTWEAVDEHYIHNLGEWIYDTRFVLGRKRDGSYKARLVLRGDYQVFQDPDSVDVDEEDENDWTSKEADIARAETYVAHGSSAPDISDDDESVSGSLPSDVFMEERLHDDIVINAGDKGEHVDLLDEMRKARESQSSSFAMAGIKTKAELTYRQLFSPTMAKVMLFLILNFAVTNNEWIFTADVSTAFLHAFLYEDEQLFCRPPAGYESHPAFKGKFMKLIKALYGARQSSRRWWEHLAYILTTKMGMTRLVSDPCVWILDTRDGRLDVRIDGLDAANTSGLFIKLAAHVDDFLMTVNNKKKFLKWFAVLATHLKIKLVEVTMIGTDYMSLNLKYDRTLRKLWLSQTGFIWKLLKMHNLVAATSCNTPMIANHAFTTESQPDEIDIERRKLYRSVVCSANWLVQWTCPEGLVAVSTLSRYLQNPSAEMLRAAFRLLRYFKWTIENEVEGLLFDGMPYKNGTVHDKVFGAKKKNQLIAYTDASYLPKELEDKSRSRGGEVLMANDCLVSAKTSIISKVCLSATEAEYRNLSETARAVLYLRNCSEELHETQYGPTLIAEDNTAAIQIAENPGKHRGRIKHVNVSVHHIVQEIEDETIQLKYCRTSDMLADALTKSLVYKTLAPFASKMKGKKFPPEAPPTPRHAAIKRKAEGKLDSPKF
jgi:hypothetical protein